MTQDFDGPVSEGVDIYVDFDLVKENPLKYLCTTYENLRTDKFKDYSLAQIKEAEINVEIAYDNLSDIIRPAFMNERIYIWAGLADLKENKGYTPRKEEEEPSTRKPKR